MLSVVHTTDRHDAKRRGAIVVVVVLLLIPLLAFMAFCVDIGWITVTKSELQNAADSSAAAGARQLMDNYGAYSLPAQPNRAALIDGAKQAASTYSRRFGGYNAAGGVTSLTILPEDIRFGFTDANGVFQAGASGYPNTVQVLARRDASANGALPLFFARVLGMSDTTVSASAAATIYTGLIASFDANGGGEGPADGGGAGSAGEFSANGEGAWGEDYGSAGDGFQCSLLPVAFDVNTWTTFCETGLSPDNVLHTDVNEAPQMRIYPSPQTAPGNVGLLCLGTWTNSDPAYRNWILNGPGEGDLQSLAAQGSFPVSMDSPRPWKGSPGLKSELRAEFEAIIGQPRLLPLFQPASLIPYQAAAGTGSNATYNIVGFVGVMVTEVTGNGGNLNISVQPCDVVDPTAVFDPATLFPAGAEPATQLRTFTHTAPKFTR